MASVRVTEILAAVRADSSHGSGLAAGLVHACARSLPVSGVGLALMTTKGPAGTVAVTDGPALELEELQFTLGEGACMDAARTGRPVLVPDMADVTESARWPVYAAAVVEQACRVPELGHGV